VLPGTVSAAMARIMRESCGKGPARSRTYVCDRFVFSVLGDVLTPVEHALKEGGRAEFVRRLRLTFEAVMTARLTAEVERLTDRRVVGHHSQLVFDPDLAIEIFVLEKPVAESPPARREGRLRAAIANAMARTMHEHWGTGPTRAKAYLEDNFLFCVLEDPLTAVERTLINGGQHDLVRRLRLEFQELKGPVLTAAVEQLTGRTVLTCQSEVVFDPDMVIQVFVLAAPAPERMSMLAA
jgi:uncharacterized protein YbcI